MILKFWNPETECWVYEDGITRLSSKSRGAILATYKDGRDKTFLFPKTDDRVFLLNDEGKTIERL